MPTPLRCRHDPEKFAHRLHEWNRHSCLYELLPTQTAAVAPGRDRFGSLPASSRSTPSELEPGRADVLTPARRSTPATPDSASTTGRRTPRGAPNSACLDPESRTGPSHGSP